MHSGAEGTPLQSRATKIASWKVIEHDYTQ